METNNATLPMNFSNARFESMKPGSVTWNKGIRVTVLDFLADVYAVPMYRVAFADGRIGTFKPSELGLKASDVPAFLARQAA